MNRQEREQLGIAVTGGMTVLLLTYALALFQAVDSGSEPPGWGAS